MGWGQRKRVCKQRANVCACYVSVRQSERKNESKEKRSSGEKKSNCKAKREKCETPETGVQRENRKRGKERGKEEKGIAALVLAVPVHLCYAAHNLS